LTFEANRIDNGGYDSAAICIRSVSLLATKIKSPDKKNKINIPKMAVFTSFMASRISVYAAFVQLPNRRLNVKEFIFTLRQQQPRCVQVGMQAEREDKF